MRHPFILLLSLSLTAAPVCAELPGPIPVAPPPVRLTTEEPYTADLRMAQVLDEEGEKVRPDIHYVPTPQQLVDQMLLMAQVKKDDMLYDLGSGDGRLVITAAKTYGTRGIGIDIDPQRIAEAQANAAAAKVEDKVEFRRADLFKSNFKDATVITLYLLDTLNRKLRPQIFAQVKPGTRIVSHAFRMGDWEPDAEKSLKISGSEYDAYFWVVPANVSGRWKISGDRAKGMPETVEIEQVFQMITARNPDGGEVLGEGRVEGTEFNLALRQGAAGKATTFHGKIDGNTIEASAPGKAGKWKAAREPGTEKPLDAEEMSASP